jgi:ABC-type antimicrobial peptide transport system permease subunit
VEVVGVAADATLFDVRGRNHAIAYVPSLQAGTAAHFKFLVVRAPAASTRAIGDALESIGVEVMSGVQTMEYTRARTLLQERLLTTLSAYASALSVILATAGTYGLLSYVLSLRRKELGIRMALGADAWKVAGTIAGTALRVTAIGLAIGVAGAGLSAPLLRRVLSGISPHDPLAMAAACALLLAATAAASIVPSLRAARVDPTTELRRD